MAVQSAVARTWQEITGKTLVEAYGLTETSPAALMNPMNIERHNGFIGLPIPETDGSIANDEGESLPVG